MVSHTYVLQHYFTPGNDINQIVWWGDPDNPPNFTLKTNISRIVSRTEQLIVIYLLLGKNNKTLFLDSETV